MYGPHIIAVLQPLADLSTTRGMRQMMMLAGSMIYSRISATKARGIYLHIHMVRGVAAEGVCQLQGRAFLVPVGPSVAVKWVIGV